MMTNENTNSSDMNNLFPLVRLPRDILLKILEYIDDASFFLETLEKILEEKDYWKIVIKSLYPMEYKCLKKSDQKTYKEIYSEILEKRYGKLEEKKRDVFLAINFAIYRKDLTKIAPLNLDITSLLNIQDAGGNNPILWASLRKRTIVLDYFYKEIVQPFFLRKRIDEHGNTKFHWASICGQLDVMKKLMAEVAVAIHQKSKNGNTPLHFASGYGHLDVVQYLLGQEGVKINQVNKRGNTPLWVASLRGHFEVVEVLLNNNAEVNQANKSGVTPLWVASQEGHFDVIECLLNNKAEVNQANKDGVTPLWVASFRGHLEVLKILLNNKAEVNQANNSGVTPLWVASQEGCLDVIECLLTNKAEVNQANKNGATPLWIASQEGHLEVIKVLLQNGAEVNQAGIHGSTPLYVASQEGHLKVVEYLLQNGAKANQACKRGATPTVIAKQYGHQKVCRLLSLYDASKSFKDRICGYLEISQNFVSTGKRILTQLFTQEESPENLFLNKLELATNNDSVKEVLKDYQKLSSETIEKILSVLFPEAMSENANDNNALPVLKLS